MRPWKAGISLREIYMTWIQLGHNSCLESADDCINYMFRQGAQNLKRWGMVCASLLNCWGGYFLKEKGKSSAFQFLWLADVMVMISN